MGAAEGHRSGYFNSKKPSVDETPAFFRTAGVKSHLRNRFRSRMQTSDTHQVPWPSFRCRVFYEKVQAFPANAQRIGTSLAIGEILEGPIRKTEVRNHRPEVARSLGLEFVVGF